MTAVGLNLPSTCHQSSGSVKKSRSVHTAVQGSTWQFTANYNSKHLYFTADKQDNNSQRLINSKKDPLSFQTLPWYVTLTYLWLAVKGIASLELKPPQTVLPVSASQRAVCSHFSTGSTIPDNSFSVCLANRGLRRLQRGLLSWHFPQYPHTNVFI